MGETMHAVGRDGALRAKRWLEATTRVDAPWINPEAVEKLAFNWHDGSQFTFDIGGLLRGGDLEGQQFLGEVKKYNQVGEQGTMYTEYLAKCFRAYTTMPGRCDHFMWITWHPFSLNRWAGLCGPAEVRAAVLEHHVRCLGIDDLQQADDELPNADCEALAERLWLLVLSDKQETLVIDDDDLDHVVARQRRRHR
jgi:hypothetical protein